MAADMSVYFAVAKDVWTQDKLEELLVQDAPTLDALERTRRFTIGKQAIVPLRLGRNGGYTALADNESVLNPAGNQRLGQATYGFKNHFVQIKVLHSAIAGTGTDAQSVVNAVDTEVQGAVNDLKHQLERQIFGPGDGTIAGVASGTGNDLTLDSAHALDMGYIEVGSQIDVGTMGNPVSAAAGRTVTAVDKATSTITVSGAAVTLAGSEFVSWRGTRLGGVNREMTSLRQIVSDDQVVGGIDPANEPAWTGSLVDDTTANLTLESIYSLRTATVKRTGKAPDMLVMGPRRYQELYQLIQPQVRYTGEGNLGTGDISKVKFAGYTILEDPKAPENSVFALTRDSLFLVATDKPQWPNAVVGGSSPLAWIPGEAAYGGMLEYHVNLATNNRAANSAYVGLTV